MTDPHASSFLRIPFKTLAALDWRPYHFWAQPVHHLIRLAHILSVSAFFGGIVLFDLRLMGVRGTVPLKPFAEHTLPWLHGVFALALLSGAALFFYDPVHAGSHAYFVPKLLLLGAGLANALVFHRTSYVAALAPARTMPVGARAAGFASLALWTGVMVCACLNEEAAPKIMLR